MKDYPTGYPYDHWTGQPFIDEEARNIALLSLPLGLLCFAVFFFVGSVILWVPGMWWFLFWVVNLAEWLTSLWLVRIAAGIALISYLFQLPAALSIVVKTAFNLPYLISGSD